MAKIHVSVPGGVQLSVRYRLNTDRINLLQEAIKAQAKWFVNECLEEAHFTMRGYERARALGIAAEFAVVDVREEDGAIAGGTGDTRRLDATWGKTNLRFGFWYNQEFGRNPTAEDADPLQENPESLDIWELPLETLLETVEEPTAGRENWGTQGLGGGLRPGRFIRGARLEAIKKAIELAPSILENAIEDVQASGV